MDPEVLSRHGSRILGFKSKARYPDRDLDSASEIESCSLIFRDKKALIFDCFGIKEVGSGSKVLKTNGGEKEIMKSGKSGTLLNP
jgi:hypothetical protein